MNMNSFLLMVLLCFSCDRGLTGKSQINWTQPVIEGHWKWNDVEIVTEVPFLHLQAPKPEPSNMVSEESPWDSYSRHDLVFEKDQMYMIDYPIQAYSPVPYFLDSGIIHVGQKENFSAYPAEIIHDTLILYRPVRSEPAYFKETYVKTTFNDSTLDILKRYEINYPELAGTWILVREEDYDYGTHYELNFPHTLPDSFEFSRAQMLAALEGKNTIMMRTDRILREYSFVYRDNKIYCKPGNWYKKEDDPVIYFRKKQEE